jgi:hypothetical protein
MNSRLVTPSDFLDVIKKHGARQIDNVELDWK